MCARRWNSFLNDKLAVALGDVLAENKTLTSVNLESNLLRAPGIEAIAAGLAQNRTLKVLKMANLHAPGSSSVIKVHAGVEMRIASAVEWHPALLKLTADLRHVPARDVVRKTLERNAEKEREMQRRGSAGSLAEET